MIPSDAAEPEESLPPALGEARLTELLALARSHPPPVMNQVSPDDSEPKPGQIWETCAAPSSLSAESSRLLVYISEQRSSPVGNIYLIAPLFTALELASDEDAILPSSALGFTSALAVGRVVGVFGDVLLDLVTSLTPDWMGKVRDFAEWLRSSEKVTTAGSPLMVGPPVIDRRDSAAVFHRELCGQLEYLQESLWQKLEEPDEFPDIEEAFQKIEVGEREVKNPYRGGSIQTFSPVHLSIHRRHEVGELIEASQQTTSSDEFEIIGRNLRLVALTTRDNTRFSIFDASGEFCTDLSGAVILVGKRTVAVFSGASAHCSTAKLKGGFELLDREGQPLSLRRITGD